MTPRAFFNTQAALHPCRMQGCFINIELPGQPATLCSRSQARGMSNLCMPSGRRNARGTRTVSFPAALSGESRRLRISFHPNADKEQKEQINGIMPKKEAAVLKTPKIDRPGEGCYGKALKPIKEARFAGHGRVDAPETFRVSDNVFWLASGQSRTQALQITAWNAD